jgi:peptide deformylase
MAVLKVRIYGDPCLKEKSDTVEEFGEELKRLVADMGETMYASKGIGLAAPQVGVNKRVFVMDTDWVEEEGGKKTGKRRLRAFINPEFTWQSEEDEAVSEGCLSLPDLEGDVYRPISVRMRWTDLKGAKHEETLDGLMARCVQHETDHLDGVLFVDRMPFVKRSLLAGKLHQIKKRSQKETAPESGTAA